MRAFNGAADWISERAWSDKVFTTFAMQSKHYKTVRALFGLGAQAACLVFAKVSDAYKLDKKTQRQFRPLGAVAFDIRNLKLYLEKQIASIWTIQGRMKIPFVCGEFQRGILKRGLIKQCDLIIRKNGKVFLHVSVVLPDELERPVTDMLGVDLGIACIAYTSDGKEYSGRKLNAMRHRHQALRRKLQKIGTKSAKRLLRKRGLKESRFTTDTNHCISKQIVLTAKCTGRGIAIEQLEGIRNRIKARKKERTRLHGWSFYQLGSFLQYKAKRNGVKLVKVDPAYTSQRCSSCGHIEKANRKTRSGFVCVACGHTSHADLNGAENVRILGLHVIGSGTLRCPNAEVISGAN